tara:strand:+ start:1518 stop:1859 length:342 start_codon:yes stop_codon:yes gene_type:complete
MDYFLKANKNLITFLLLMLIVIPIFGINFLISFLGNIIILLFLIPVLLLLLFFIGFNSFKSKINTCDSCGAISLGLSGQCMNCGADLDHVIQGNQIDKKPNERTIEVKAEEIK